jgi:uncharacterized protein YciI
MEPAETQPEQYFLCRLLAPRPTFPFDMSDSERVVMNEHAGYWRARMAQGQVVVFGPVFDPKGPWGLGIVRVRDEAAARALCDADPVITAGLGFSWEIMLMPSIVLP